MERHRRRKEKSSAEAAHHTILTALHSVFCFVLLCIEIGSYYEVLAGLKLKRQMRVCLSNAGIKAVCYYAGSGEKKKDQWLLLKMWQTDGTERGGQC